MGLPPEMPVVAFPVETFLPGSDLAGVQSRKQEFYDGLTSWRSAQNFLPSDATPLIKVTGATYQDALTNANNMLLTNLWSDGLPIWPATEALVDWILQGTDTPRDNRPGQSHAARRGRHGRVLRHRSGDGGRAAGISAGADRRGRSLSRSALRQRTHAGRFGRRVPGRHRQRTDRRTDTAEHLVRLPRPRSAAARGREHRPGAASDAAESRRRIAGHRRHGDVGRHAVSPTRYSARTKTICRTAGSRTAPNATVSSEASVRPRWCGRPGSPISGAAA